jgi:hypothetical protein
VALLVVAGSILGPARVFACPRCYTSELVRGLVLGPAFFSDLLVVSLPFIVLGSIAVIVHRMSAKR